MPRMYVMSNLRSQPGLRRTLTLKRWAEMETEAIGRGRQMEKLLVVSWRPGIE